MEESVLNHTDGDICTRRNDRNPDVQHFVNNLSFTKISCTSRGVEFMIFRRYLINRLTETRSSDCDRLNFF